MVRIPAFHAGGPGSIPGVGMLRFFSTAVIFKLESYDRGYFHSRYVHQGIWKVKGIL